MRNRAISNSTNNTDNLEEIEGLSRQLQSLTVNIERAKSILTASQTAAEEVAIRIGQLRSNSNTETGLEVSTSLSTAHTVLEDRREFLLVDKKEKRIQIGDLVTIPRATSRFKGITKGNVVGINNNNWLEIEVSIGLTTH